ncbi:MAG: dihydrodipicolinate synthase family protein [Anaerolineae bacterium]|nr:dihydrodipicolinate synthase family protein [Anaerolineae bacterium]
MKTVNLNGIIPAIVTPMKVSGEIDLPQMRKYVNWLVEQGPVALAVNVDTGEGPHLTPDEKRMIIETVAETAAGRCAIVAGIAGPSTALAISNAKAAQTAGADAMLVFPVPAFLGTPLNIEVPYQYHAAIADAVDLPMILFQLQPALGGVLFSNEILHRLIEIPTVAAIKEASFDAMRFLQVKAALETASRRITLLNGNDNFIFEAFVLGAEGALLGFSTIGTREQVALFELVKQGDIPEAQKLSKRLQPLADIVFASPVTDYRARTKEALKMLGVLPSAVVRPPLLPISELEIGRLQYALKRSELLM